ncbi:MAG: NUDIX hydrolase [Alphaproteobacteria bacterium]|jgi:8-oxo-dGTP diphosphatase|nr:NUDIX hydrolase [Alphaproteobacteria bacterium]
MHAQPKLTVDAVVFDGEDRLLLIKRKSAPFKGYYALPGGFVEVGETVEQAACRELMEETGVTAKKPQLVGIYSAPGRDPRGHVVSIAFLMELTKATAKAGDDAAAAEFVTDWRSKQLAFDHNKIVSDAVALRRERRK